jgi:PhoPQ-activated pathogenicity-related protein
MVLARAFRLPALVGLLAGLWVCPARADLREYVKKADPAFAWKLNKKSETAQGTVYDFHLVSQVWEKIQWEHQLQVYQPKGVVPNATLLLWNQGGKASIATTLFGMELARKTKAPCAFLYGIPNQPLLGGKKEDTLIAETFVRYLKTKDEDWPLLFPMVKSLVKAMDALQAFGKKEWNKPVKDFIVCGASKRGWTTWLTGAVDPRVKAIAPLVIDTLNMRVQMPHQLKSFGKYSEQIADYTRRGLVPAPNTPEAKRLWSLVDPYSYRDKLTLPKFIINGNNDPYWTVDALNLYWDGLKGDKWVMYVPNAGHNLQQKGKDGKGNVTRAVNGLAAFARHYIQDNPMPKLTWKHDDAGGKMRLTVQAKPAPLAARLWVAEAPTRDFRKAKWLEQAAKVRKGTVLGEVENPREGCRAFYAELDYEIDGIRYYLSTQIRVAGKPVKK